MANDPLKETLPLPLVATAKNTCSFWITCPFSKRFCTGLKCLICQDRQTDRPRDRENSQSHVSNVLTQRCQCPTGHEDGPNIHRVDQLSHAYRGTEAPIIQGHAPGHTSFCTDQQLIGGLAATAVGHWLVFRHEQLNPWNGGEMASASGWG